MEIDADIRKLLCVRRGNQRYILAIDQIDQVPGQDTGFLRSRDPTDIDILGIDGIQDNLVAPLTSYASRDRCRNKKLIWKLYLFGYRETSYDHVS